jgi:hypothetical protein
MVALLSSSAYSVKSQVNSIAQAEMPSQDRQRKQEQEYAFRAYKGKLPDPLKVDKDQPNDNIKSNRCEPIVNKGASALFGDVLKIEASDETTKEDTKIQDFIEGLWGDDDDRMTKLNKVGVNGGCFGHSFLKLIPARGRMKYPRIVNLNPQIVRIVTSPEDCDLHVAYIIETPGAGSFQKRQVIARVDPDNSAPTVGAEEDMNDYWTITNYVRMDQFGMWQQSGPVDLWDYPFAPIFCCQNLPNPNEAWGTPDLTPDLIQLNESLNFLLSSLARITKYHGHPTAVATGVYASEIDTSINGIVCLPTKDSTYTKVDAMTDFSGLLGFIDDVRSSMDEQSRINAAALGRLKDIVRGTISGIALKLMFQPLVEKTTLKKRLYGHLIKNVTRAALVVQGLIPIEEYEDYPVALHWSSILPSDDLQDANGAIALQSAGVSKSTSLNRIGVNAQEEAEKIAKEKEEEAKLQPAQDAQPAPVAGQEQQTAPGVGAQPGQQKWKQLTATPL